MFTVKIEPSTLTTQADGRGGEVSHRTVYDIKVYDGEGEGGEDLLVFSNQGYENRAFAVELARRLFGTSTDKVQLKLLGADGTVDAEMALR